MLSLSCPDELRLLQNIADNLDQGFMLLDSDLRIRYLNTKAAEMVKKITGTGPTAGMAVTAFCRVSSKPRMRALAEKAVAGGPITWTRKFRTKAPVVYQFAVNRFDGEDGFSGMLIKMNDITQPAGLEEQLDRKQSAVSPCYPGKL
ncbi:PAS domain-containing protein [Puia sp. P3]|uniref:PAS domain-containing protein n=1 Tax=Puia sp. P3 TaxID=3423952 RepID=UPI003D6744D5